MSAERWSIACLLAAILVGGSLIPSIASGQASETAGMITEIRNGRGRVEVRPAGGSEWRAAGPLQAVRPGDLVRASGDAWAVIVWSGGRGSLKVDAAASPFTVPAAQAAEGKLQKVRTLLEASFNYMTSSTKGTSQVLLTTRGRRPPTVLSPRNGTVLPGPLTFEWLGSTFSRYTVRLVGPSGVVLERPGRAGGRFEYPPDGPPLVSGVRYTFQVQSGGDPPQEAWFEVMDTSRAAAVRQDLAELEQALGSAVSPNSMAALRATLLAKEGLIHDARLILVAALTRDPDEPTLHQLLGDLYTKSGLRDQAAESYDEAQFLLTNPSRGTAPPGR